MKIADLPPQAVDRAAALCSPANPSGRLSVAFLANKFLDPHNPGCWSGLPHFTHRALEKAGLDLRIVWARSNPGLDCWGRFLYWRFRQKRYLRYAQEALLRRQAREVERQLASGPRVDAVFSLTTWLVAYLRTELPTVLYTDASFGAMLDFYESFTRLAPPSVQDGHRIEQRALRNCTRLIYSTTWAAESAQHYYEVDARKTDVVYFGANFDEPPDPTEVTREIFARDLRVCHLLLVGVDWRRKGVDIAIDAVQSLRERGVAAQLTVVGCQPPPGVRVPEGVEVIPFISKATAEGRARLSELYHRSHFFILPSRAEAAGIVFSEASAYGVPSLAPDIGGISSVVRHERNGLIFAANAQGRDYADGIASVIKDPAHYRVLAISSLEEATMRLSWAVSGAKIAAIIAETVGKKSPVTPIPALLHPAPNLALSPLESLNRRLRA